MPAEPGVIDWKYANRLVADAEPRAIPKLLAFGVLGRMKRAMGGLWVGGSVTLTRAAVVFTPNAVNAAVHTGYTALGIDLADVAEVTDRFGWFTRIVDVRAAGGTTLTFRCYGAKAFAEKIRRAATESRAR